jgi:hypothetical protein
VTDLSWRFSAYESVIPAQAVVDLENGLTLAVMRLAFSDAWLTIDDSLRLFAS